MDYLRVLRPYIVEEDKIIKGLLYSLSPLYKEQFGGGQDVTVPLFTALHSTSESALILLENQAVFDADILLRTIMEGTIKYCYLMQGSEAEREGKYHEYKISLYEIEKLKDHQKAMEALEILEQYSQNSLTPFEAQILPDNAVDSLRQKYPREVRKKLEQKWSYQSLLRDLASIADEYKAQLGSLSTYALTSHFCHFDWTGVSQRIATIVPDSACNNEMADIAQGLRIASNILSFYLFRVIEYMRTNCFSQETTLQLCDTAYSVIADMDKQSNSIIELLAQ